MFDLKMYNKFLFGSSFGIFVFRAFSPPPSVDAESVETDSEVESNQRSAGSCVAEILCPPTFRREDTSIPPSQFFAKSKLSPLKAHIEQSSQWFFLYGQESTRKQLRRKLAYIFRQREADDRFFYHTIDSINNVLAGCWLQRLVNPNLKTPFNPPLTVRQENFVISHYKVVLDKVIERDLTNLDDILKLACTIALEEVPYHDIHIFFNLDGIDWDSLMTTYKQSVTTGELMTIYRIAKLEEPLAHVTFIQGDEIIPLATVMEKVSNSLEKEEATLHVSRSRAMAP